VPDVPSPKLPLVHLNLTVADVGRSLEFYRRWFGFDGPPRHYDDGTVFVANADGFDLAFHPGSPPSDAGAAFHFGFRVGEARSVTGLHDALRRAGVGIVEADDEPGFASFKCVDPDGYRIEVYWESAV
jgi:catechol 2,3-dioxygenase-like lactoylglutathione lyase family enzyme